MSESECTTAVTWPCLWWHSTNGESPNVLNVIYGNLLSWYIDHRQADILTPPSPPPSPRFENCPASCTLRYPLCSWKASVPEPCRDMTVLRHLQCSVVARMAWQRVRRVGPNWRKLLTPWHFWRSASAPSPSPVPPLKSTLQQLDNHLRKPQ